MSRTFPGLFMQVSLLVVLLASTSCRNDTGNPITRCKTTFPAPSSDNVLKNLETVLKNRDSEQFPNLLADDFRFYFDSATRDSLQLPEFWNKSQDSLAVTRLLSAPEVKDIRVRLQYNPSPSPVNEVGREDWLMIEGRPTIEIDYAPGNDPSAALTLVIQGFDRFYFRKGRSAQAVIDGTPCPASYYLVEWRELAREQSIRAHHSDGASPN